MLRITLADETWTFDEESMLNTEAIALKRTTGLTISTLLGGIYTGDPEAITALVWLCRRRAGVTDDTDDDNRYSKIVFDIADFDWDPIDDEGRVLRFKDGVIVSRDGVPEPAPEGGEEGEPDPTVPPSEES